jgi:pimeloyl-ACP methyl ester carboxylesterase
VDVDQPLDTRGFHEFVRSFAGALQGPGFREVWAMFEAGMRMDLLDPAARAVADRAYDPRSELVTSYWRDLFERTPDELAGLVDATTAAVRAAGVPYALVMGSELAPADRSWFEANLPGTVVLGWPECGHLPQLAHPQRFARVLAATAAWPQEPLAVTAAAAPAP